MLGAMERTKWTDERLDDRFSSIDRNLVALDRDIRELRTEMRTGFAEMRQVMYRLFGGLFVAMVVNSVLQGAI